MQSPLVWSVAFASVLFVCSDLSAQAPGTVLWEFEDPPVDVVTTPAVGTNGLVYFGDFSGGLYCVSPAGTQVWSRTLSGLLTTPIAIGSQGNLFFAIGGRKLLALKSDGSDLWEIDTPNDVRAPLAISQDGTVYYGCHDYHLYAVSPQGSNLWSFPTEFMLWSAPVIGSDGTIYMGSQDATVYAIWPDGSERWRYRTFGAITASPALGADGTVYVADDNERLYSLSPSGVKQWDLLLPGFSAFTPIVLAPDGTLFVTGWGGKLAAVSSGGSVKWQLETGGTVTAAPALSSDGSIYYGIAEGVFQSLDGSGQPLWQFTHPSGFHNAPVLTPDGTIYLGWNRLWAIAASSGPPESGWPMLQRNPQHTGRVRGQPQIELTAPADGSRFLPGTDITLEASVVVSEAAISSVEFLADGQIIGSVSASPYQFTWLGVPVGNYALAAVATDTLGLSSTSSTATITVTAEPQRYPLQTGSWGRGQVERSPNLSAYDFGAQVSITALPDSLSQFSQWTDGDVSNPRSLIIGASNRYVAIFTNTMPVQTHLVQQWDAAFGSMRDDLLTAVAPAHDGGWFIAGHSPFGNSGTKFLPGQGDQDFWIVRMDPSRRKSWEAVFGGTGREALAAVVALPDGGCLLGGSSVSGVSGNKDAPGFGGSDYWIVRVDADGRKLWDRAFGGSQDDVLTSMALTFDGFCVAGGYSNSTAGGNKTASNLGGEDFWVAEFDLEGNLISDHTFGGVGDDRCRVTPKAQTPSSSEPP